ncbi:MAG: glycosyltransferase family 1 protein [Fibrobacter sp.]|nr:glycosyltransferase family 1 protein [Fibrobacter sp.]
MIIIDINNFWSPSGGGVRRYHLEKMDFYQNRTDAQLVFITPSTKYYTEVKGPGLIIEHVPAPKLMGNWDYRFIWRPDVLYRLLKKHQPDIIEVGSPYWLPTAVQMARAFASPKSKLVGFWHADFPVTYVRRAFLPKFQILSSGAESAAWLYARWEFRSYNSILVSSKLVQQRMEKRGLSPTQYLPLGVDADLFHPDKKDDSLVQKYKAGLPERLTMFFPHRLSEEKGLLTLLEAYPMLCKLLNHEPAIIFAGQGNYEDLLKSATQKHEHIHFLGFIEDKDEMARLTASFEMGLAMSGWETFGLSILEAMASGQVLVGADTGAALEHIEAAESGLAIAPGNAKVLAEAIAQAYKSPQFAQWSKNARLYAEKFDWEDCFVKQKQKYQSMLVTEN